MGMTPKPPGSWRLPWCRACHHWTSSTRAWWPASTRLANCGQPDVILSADAFKAAMVPLEPHIKSSRSGQPNHKFVIGVVQGDMHDLGKSLVVAMLTSAGFEVIDLGIDVPKDQFIDAIRQHRPAILGLGAYMSTTMLEMKDIISELGKQGLRQGLKVMVGGVPTSQEFADEVGADAWGKDAMVAMQKALELVGGTNG
jgi:5-methyltetrahydrofolate--homocysteine methyltransferase